MAVLTPNLISQIATIFDQKVRYLNSIVRLMTLASDSGNHLKTGVILAPFDDTKIRILEICPLIGTSGGSCYN